MLKDVLTILFYALLYSTTLYVVLRFTYKLGRYRAEEAWPMKWRAFDNRVGKKATQKAVSAAAKKAIVTVTRRAVPMAITMAEDTKPLPSITENNLKR